MLNMAKSSKNSIRQGYHRFYYPTTKIKIFYNKKRV